MAMFDNDFVWRDRFRDKDVSDLDWLEPKADTFDQIEATIYGTEQKDRILPFIIIPVLLLIGIVLGYNASSEAPSQELLSSIETIKEEIAAVSLKQSSAKDDSKEVKALVINNTAPYLPRTTNQQFATASVLENVDNPSTSTSRMSTLVESSSNTLPLTLKPAKLLKQQEATLVDLDSKLFSLEYPVEYPLLPTLDLEKSSNKNNVQWYSTLGGGAYSFNLNQNFESAVEPADFWHSTGQGYEVGLGMVIPLSDILSIDVGLTYGAFNLTSGHNSEVIYSSSQEQDLSNKVNLTMATPLGFIEGETVIQRQSTNNQDQTLSLGLTNHHSISHVNLHLLGALSIYNTKRWKLDVLGGMKLNTFVSAKDDLRQVTLDNIDYAIASAKTTTTSNLTSGLNSMILTGVNVDLPIRMASQSLFVRYVYGQTTNPIFQQDNLTTTYNHHSVSIGLRF